MRETELAAFRQCARSKQKWEFTARLLERMLNDLGVDVTAVMQADKDEVIKMLLDHHGRTPP